MHSVYTRGVFHNITPSSLEKRDNSVGSVISLGKSEKSPENFPRKVFQNVYTAYTDISLELHQWLNAAPLHPARGTRLVDLKQILEFGSATKGAATSTYLKQITSSKDLVLF